jgi:predicted transcriptional regulator
LVEYREIAQMPVQNLLGDQDVADVFSLETSLREAASAVTKSLARAVVVSSEGVPIGVLREEDVGDALRQGTDPTTTVGDLLSRLKDKGEESSSTISEDATIEQIADMPQTEVLVVKGSAGQTAVVRRSDLANRVRRLA